METAPNVPLGGLLQLVASVVLLSSAWPLTKIALDAGSTPLWFAEGRAVLSALVAAALLILMRRFRLPSRADLPAMLAIGGLQLGAYFALAHEAVAWVPAGRTASWRTPRRSGLCRCRWSSCASASRPAVG